MKCARKGDHDVNAEVVRLPSPLVLRALEEIGEIGTLAVEAWRSGDRDMVHDCGRWHDQRRAVIVAAARAGGGYLLRHGRRP